MAKPRLRPDRPNPSPAECDETGGGPRSFGVWLRPNFALMCDPDVPLSYNRRVVVQIALDGDKHYCEGKVLTKRPDRAKRIAVRLNNRGLVHRASREDVARVIGEYTRKPFDIIKA